MFIDILESNQVPHWLVENSMLSFSAAWFCFWRIIQISDSQLLGTYIWKYILGLHNEKQLMIETAIVSVTIIIYIPSTQACRRKSSDKLSENVAPPVELTDAEKH